MTEEMYQVTTREFRHPRSGRVIVGVAIEPGETLLETDVYDSTSGEWVPCPCPGVRLQSVRGATWVRPVA